MLSEKSPKAKRMPVRFRLQLSLPKHLEEWRSLEQDLGRWRRLILWVADLVIEVWRRFERARPLVQRIERWLKIVGRILPWLLGKFGSGR